jgi:CPA1 family monovalent cation:H+ antiporter
MTAFEIIAAILSLTAFGGYVNQRFLRLPSAIGMMAFAFLISLAVLIIGKLGWINLRIADAFINQIDFSTVLLHGMLSFMLFAGALHINIEDLKKVRLSVSTLATIGVVIATFVIGTLIWLGSSLIGIHLPYLYALLFGALISPTDPIAVLSILKKAGISKKLYAKIGGESLFNDGVGIVVFVTILGLATGNTQPEFFSLSILLAQQVVGGMILGLLLGWIAYRLLRSIDAYRVEILLTLALASGGYVIAEHLHVSAPIYMVTAGLVIGNRGRNSGMSEQTRVRLDDFWELIDEVLNAVLFMLIGLEIIVISVTSEQILLGLMAIASVLLGRVVSVGIASILINIGKPFDWRTVGLLTWGGLRGGLSIAMALSIPVGSEKSIILPITYIVVLFSILIQGLTFKPALKLFIKR